MEVLAGLSFVDYVTPMGEETADELIETLRPSIYAKGTDYTLRTLPEKDTLKELDLKAVFVGDKKAHSSSKLVQKIRKRKFS
jgi:bifunctional ADP-heptose synthase (sugar kinase/adenylyltransferase)